jgi:tRNA 2-thiouridine synthesizing protein A
MECIDLRGKVCPFVLFYTKKRLEAMPSGEKLEVITNDPAAKETIPGWCKSHSHEILKIYESGGKIKIIIKKH